jgi:hypothetical protein
VKRHIMLLPLATVGLSAAAVDVDAIKKCREQRDGGARLVCYDAIQVQPASVAPVGLDRPTMASGVSTAPLSTPTFGLEARGSPTSVPLLSIESAVDGQFQGWLPRQRINLANGQVWEIADGSSAAYNLMSPKVKITRGMSGSFFIAFEGVAQTPRVRRVR